nr:xanthine dehydrogenase family protein molybdopterin-binding subunit [Sneathiella aquimaris]
MILRQPSHANSTQIEPQRVSIGQPVKRIEDARLVRGEGCYADDVTPENCLHVKFLRSSYPSGRITDLQIDGALSAPGVKAVFTADDTRHIAGLSVNPIIKNAKQTHYPLLADKRVMAVGQPIVAVIAQTALQATDALELIYLEIEEEDTVLGHSDPEQSRPLFSEFTDNIAFEENWRSDNWTTDAVPAQQSVSLDIQHPRVAPSALEPRSITVQWETASDTLSVWIASQTPHRARTDLSEILDHDLDSIQVISRDVGGAFGMKASLYPEEILTVWAAKRLGQSTKWTSTRGEDLQSASHGRGIRTRATLGLRSDGTFVSLQAEALAPLGHWLTYSATVPAWNAVRILPGPYDIDRVDLTTKGALSNTAPVGIYRGAGRPEAAMIMERLIDEAAYKLGRDPLDLRLQNLLSAEALPHVSVSGRKLDTGDYPAALTHLSEFADYPALRERQKKRRAEGRIFGIGLACYVEPSGVGWETAHIKLTKDGHLIAATGTSSQGHGRETAFSQIVSDVFAAPLDKITLEHGDSRTCPSGVGALASRSTGIGGSALLGCAEKLLAQLKALLARSLQMDESSISLDDRGHFVLEDTGQSWSLAQLANLAENPSQLEADYRFESDGEAWGYGSYLATVEIVAETGEMTIEDIFCVDDAGRLVNPMLVHGQIVGGIAQGIGEATLEEIVYDEDGQLLTGSLMDYGLPRADLMPNIHISNTQTPSTCNSLGAKGVGEAGTIGAPAAIMNAALDALRPFGVTDLTMPLTSEKIWRALKRAQHGDKIP